MSIPSLQCAEIGQDKPYFSDFEVVSGFFEQQEKEGVELRPEELAKTSFGLIDKSPERWEKFKEAIKDLQSSAPPDVSYKVLYCGRHGQGWHNLGTEFYGDKWDEWRTKTGDDRVTWGPDAELTPKGRWKANLAEGCPRPQAWLLSPMTRAADTMTLTWGSIINDEKPVFIEALREVYGRDTSDQRRGKEYLMNRFHRYDFEEGFEDEDPWWTPDDRESPEHGQQRLRGFLAYLFLNRDETYISITSHSSTLSCMMSVLGHPDKDLTTAEMVPLVVKATKRNTEGDDKNDKNDRDE